jgi:hypothetical protein
MGHISESTLRSKAQRLGYRVMKSRDRRTHVNNSGGFMLVNASQNFVVAGERYDLTLGDVARHLTEIEGGSRVTFKPAPWSATAAALDVLRKR